MKYYGWLLPVTLAFYSVSYSQAWKHGSSQNFMFVQAKEEYASFATPPLFTANETAGNFLKEKISIDRKQVTLYEILREFQRQTNRQYYASQEVLSLSDKIDIHLKNASITEFLAFINSKFCVWGRQLNEIIIIASKTCYFRILCQVVNSSRMPVKAIIYVNRKDKPNVCNKNGSTYIYNVSSIDTLVVDADGYKSVAVPVDADNMTITLREKANTLSTFVVSVNNNGIKVEPVTTSTGAYLHINKLAFQNRNQDFNMIRRMQLLSMPPLINKGNSNGYTAGSARGINTFQGNRNALNIVNGHAQMINSNFFNPFDISSIFQIRDAEAASLWGVASSNGVYNFELKKGITSGCDVNLSLSRSLTQKPNLFYQPGLSAKMRIEFERLAFDANAPMAWSPVYERLSKANPAELDAITQTMMQEWGENNLTRDLYNTAYQPGDH